MRKVATYSGRPTDRHQERPAQRFACHRAGVSQKGWETTVATLQRVRAPAGGPGMALRHDRPIQRLLAPQAVSDRVLRFPHGPMQLNMDEFRHNCERERKAASLFACYAVPTVPGKVHIQMRCLVREAQGPEVILKVD